MLCAKECTWGSSGLKSKDPGSEWTQKWIRHRPFNNYSCHLAGYANLLNYLEYLVQMADSQVLPQVLTIPSLDLRSRKEHFNKIPRWFWCPLKFENHWVRIPGPWCLPVDKADCRAPPRGLKTRQQLYQNPWLPHRNLTGSQNPARTLQPSLGIYSLETTFWCMPLHSRN